MATENSPSVAGKTATAVPCDPAGETWARITREIEALRAELYRLVTKASDLTQEEVLRVSRELDALIISAQRALGKRQEPWNGQAPAPWRGLAWHRS
ncbi:MAG: aspartyl-phosphate phosphatase Spo0E family protein [Bacillota bacterium]|nr:MAG: hypothetical protein DIU69_04210 [Bacillota bacterium]